MCSACLVAPGGYTPAPAAAVCTTPGCGMFTYNGHLGQPCLQCYQFMPGAPAICGCGKPTFNTLWGAKCTKSCTGPSLPGHTAAPAPVVGAGGPVCGCGKPTFNGKWQELCAKSCKGPKLPGPAAAGAPLCGCGKPTWNGKWQELCAKSCKGPKLPAPGAGGPACGCGKPTWNGQWQELCAKSCTGPKLPGPGPSNCKAAGCSKPAVTAGYCSATCKDYQERLSGTMTSAIDPKLGCAQIPAGSTKFKELGDQCQNPAKTQSIVTHHGATRTVTMPSKVKEVWNVTNKTLLQKHFDYARKIGNVTNRGRGSNPGNMQRRFHCCGITCAGWTGTPCSDATCPLCNIIVNGFQKKFSAASNRFGSGLYSSATAVKCYGYADDHGRTQPRYMLICSVVEGVPERTEQISYGTRINTPLDSKYNSRYIKNSMFDALKPTQVVDELVVYDDDAMIPRYLIVFDV